jgi:hypothetical protein
MENSRNQKLSVLIIILFILCCIEFYFLNINTFLILKQISCSIGGFAIIYYLYAIARVLTED